LDHREKCPTCGSDRFTFTRAHHHFLESGLDNVHLTNVEVGTCSDCGEKIVSIPNSTELMGVIGESILLKPTNLNGAEIRFLRKNLHLKINEFSQLLGVDRVTVSRWENGHETLSRSTDRHIRLTYAVEAKLNEQMMEAIRRNLRTEEIDSRMDYLISLPLAS